MKTPLLLNSSIRYLLLFIICGISFVMFTVYLSSQPISLTTIEQRGDIKSPTLPHRLLKGEELSHTFVALHNNLGQIALRFQTHNRINTDSLIFRIKESEHTDWDYQATYKTDQFQPDELFPFGFPVFANSQGKKFTWQIESTSGVLLDSVSLSQDKPVFVSRYQYPRAQLKSDSKFLLNFIFNKFINVVQTPDSLLQLLAWIMPIIFYVLSTNYLYRNYLFSIGMGLLVLSVNNIFVLQQYDLITFILFVYWLSLVLIFKLKRKTIFVIALANLLLSLIFLLLKNPKQADKPFSWFLLFCLILIFAQFDFSSLIKKLRNYHSRFLKLFKK